METVDVVAAVIERGGAVLGTQRGRGEMRGGWEFPGGKVEPGETPEEALVREIREELDVRVEVGPLLSEVDYDYSTFHLHMRCYRCRICSGEPTLREHLAARWLDASSIDSVEWLPADEEVIRAIKASWNVTGK